MLRIPQPPAAADADAHERSHGRLDALDRTAGTDRAL
jgi:hypothetical protein